MSGFWRTLAGLGLFCLGNSRRLKFFNKGATDATATQVNIKDKDLVGLHQKNRVGDKQLLGNVPIKRQDMIGDNITTAPFDVELQFKDPKTHAATGPKIQMTVPATLQGTKTCIEFDEKGYKIITGDWCDEKAPNEL